MNPQPSLPFPAPGHAASGSQADEAPPSADLVTITRVFNSLEAEMLRGCLEAEGIPATLGDARTGALLTVALGGIRVMVPAAFADAARHTVEAFERGELAIDELPADAQPAATEADQPESAAGFGLSRSVWVVLAIIAVAVVVS